MKKYAGIGSRNLILNNIDHSNDLILKIHNLYKIGLKNYILRSGAAAGSDILFEICHYSFHGNKNCEIYLPWKGYNKSDSHLYNISKEAIELAKKYHPAPHNLSENAMKFISRDGYQVLGYELNDPVDFIVYWTPDPTKGGTSQALRIAKDYNIPTFNLLYDDQYEKLIKYLK